MSTLLFTISRKIKIEQINLSKVLNKSIKITITLIFLA